MRRIRKDSGKEPKKTREAQELRGLDVGRVDAVDHPATGAPFLILKAEDPTELAANAKLVVDALQKALTALTKDQRLQLSRGTAEALNTVARLVGSPVNFQGAGLTGDGKAKAEEEAEGEETADSDEDADTRKAAEDTENDADENEGGEEGAEVAAEKKQEDQKKPKKPAPGAPPDFANLKKEIVAEVGEVITRGAETTAKELVKGLAPMFAKLASVITGDDFEIKEAGEEDEKDVKKSRQAEGQDDVKDEKRPVEKKMGEGLFQDAVFSAPLTQGRRSLGR